MDTVTIKHVTLRTISEVVFQQLLKLNNGVDGQMYWILQSKSPADIFYIEDEDKIVSWGVVTKSFFTRKNTLNIFTMASYRGKALASRLIRHIQNRYPVIYGSYDCSKIFQLLGCKNSD
jgi:hypothetical protein